MRSYPMTSLLVLILVLMISSSIMAQDKIVLGQSAAFSGSSRALGIELWRGAEAYFKETNANEWLAPFKIEVLALDDSYEGDRALLNTIELVKKKQVFGLFGYVGTPTMVRALPAIHKLHLDEGIFLFSNFTGASPQRHFPYQDFIFNVRASYEEETRGLVEQLVKTGHRRLGLFIQNDAYGRSGAHGVIKALAAHQLKPVFEASYRRGSKHTQSMMRQVHDLKAADVDAIISISSYEASAAFIRDARREGLDVPIANVSFVGADQLLEILRKLETEHQINLTDNLINTQVVPPWSDTSVPIVAEYQRLMNKYSPLKPPDRLLGKQNYEIEDAGLGFTSLEGFINAKLLVALLKDYLFYLKKGTPDGRSFCEFIKNHKAIDIGLGHLMGPIKEGNQFSQRVYFTEIEPKEKVYRLIKSWDHLIKKKSSLKAKQ